MKTDGLDGTPVSAASFTVVGIGADGWAGLTAAAREAILGAGLVVGSERQLASLPAQAQPRRAWPSPLAPLLDELLAQPEGPVAVLASGNPMLHGIGATLARRLGREPIDAARLHVIPHPSALALVCARLGWPQAEVTLLSCVTSPVDVIGRVLQPTRRVIVYMSGSDGAAQLAAALSARGYGNSAFIALEQLGGPAEQISRTTARAFADRRTDPLCAVAIECRPDPGTALLPTVPGLPDDAYEHDGALTKRHVRAATLAALAPFPGALLWDIGAGSGSIGIEWLRAEPSARAIAIEPRTDRAERIGENARGLGVPQLQVITGRAPEALATLPAPDAVFIGGGLTSGVIDHAWQHLCGGGRIVANAVTIESETLLVDAQRRCGGGLVKLAVSHVDNLGGFTAWRPALPVVQWEAIKPQPTVVQAQESSLPAAGAATDPQSGSQP